MEPNRIEQENIANDSVSKEKNGSTDHHKLNRRFGRKANLVRNLIAFGLALVILVAVTAVAVVIENQRRNAIEGPHNGSYTDDSIQILVGYHSEEIVLISEAAMEYLESDNSLSIMDMPGVSGSLGDGKDKPKSVKLALSITGGASEYSNSDLILMLSRNDPNFTDPTIHYVNARDGYVELKNLYTNSKYYYKITVDGTDFTVSSSFTTADTPRFIDVEGAVNLRDFGNWQTASGKRINQGLLYRGSEIDGKIVPTMKITEDGINTMLNDLGIKTDMDLRHSETAGEHPTPLGDDVSHVYYGMPMYTYMFDKNGGEVVKTIFAELADKSNYPIYIHCTYGKDRTGEICYLLGALLGMSDEDLLRDFELSALAHGEVDLEGYAFMVNYIKSEYDGADTCQKVENYLLSIGVTSEQIASIRSIFLD